jgi:DNA-binding NtrC family response regulator
LQLAPEDDARRGAAALRLAGQRARARERARARGHPDRRATSSAARRAARAHREPAPAPLVSERPPANPTLELVERAYILWVLQAEGGNKARAAEVLGIDPSTLYRKLNRYEMSEA